MGYGGFWRVLEGLGLYLLIFPMLWDSQLEPHGSSGEGLAETGREVWAALGEAADLGMRCTVFALTNTPELLVRAPHAPTTGLRLTNSPVCTCAKEITLAAPVKAHFPALGSFRQKLQASFSQANSVEVGEKL